MKINIKVETGDVSEMADNLRACAAALRFHGPGVFGRPMVALAVAEALELEADRLWPIKPENTESRWGWL